MTSNPMDAHVAEICLIYSVSTMTLKVPIVSVLLALMHFIGYILSEWGNKVHNTSILEMFCISKIIKK